MNTRVRKAAGSSWSISYTIRSRRLFDALARFLDERLYDGAQVAGVAVHLHLPFRAGAVRQNFSHVLDLPPAVELVNHIVDELEQLHGKLAHRYFLALAEVDQLAVEAPAGRAPLVLFDERARIAAEAEIARAQAIELDDDGLRQRGDRNRCARRRRHVAHPEFQRAEGWMRPQVPPDLLRVVDAVELDEEVDVFLVFAPRPELL